MNADVVVIGAGTVGAAIGYGLARRNLRVQVLDGGDRDFRAAHANFGLIWQQGKGLDMPAYQQLTRTSVDQWRALSDELEELTGGDLHYEQNGGLMICLGEEEFEKRCTMQMRLQKQLRDEDPQWEMLDRGALEKLLPKITFGPDVTGAGFGHRDGHANPMHLLAALHAGILVKGGNLRGGVTVASIRSAGTGAFVTDIGDEVISSTRVVIAAGLGSKALAAQVGLDIPIRPQRGQILVTERVEPFLPLPMSGMRQTREGSVLIGLTHEEAGLDSSTTASAASMLSANAIRRIPAISGVKLVRQWGGLRIMTPDGYPIYAQSESHPGAFIATCHSGITLAAAHANMLAEAIAKGALPPLFNDFHQRRFDVSKAA
jgi:glycine/D-amino acid oxidase-like deaminating enzyme